ncbi:desulfoferrodoxin FeS4 iron-binding domain-containing protein [Candidatus Bathyarchaeota archaeon]|nr:desulfoferrodoxin FeS4 iron-binding domain-containing protein [Candidatus Bathyarchaeota archaeon]
MTNTGEFYACKICGNMVEVVAPGAGVLVCCGQPMELVEE